MPEKIMPKIQNPKSNKIPNHKTVKRFGIFSFLRFYWAYGKSKFQNPNSNKTPNKQNFKTFFYNSGFKGFRFYWAYGKSKFQNPNSNKTPNKQNFKTFFYNLGFKGFRFYWALGIGLWVLVALFVPVATAPLIDSQVSADLGFVAVDIDYIVDPQITSDGLVGYWKFDEGTGTSTADASGHGKTGTLVDGPTWTSSVPTLQYTNSYALSFDGENDYVSLPTDVISAAAGTISIWVNPLEDASCSAGYFCYILAHYSSGNRIYIYRSGGSTKLATSFYSNNENLTSYDFTYGQWSHIAMTWNGGTINVYANGNNVGSYSQSPLESVSSFVLNSAADSSEFLGSMDELKVYSRVLSATEITALAAGSHTSATWDGSSSTDWETAANWDINAVPDPFTNITIPDVTNQPVLTAAVGSANLTINSSATLDLAGFGYTFNDSGTFTNNGTLIMDGDETLTNFTNDLDSGTVLVNDGTSNTLSVNSYNNLTINDGLVGYWKFDESAAGTFADSSGYGNTGTGNGAAGSQNTPQPSATVPSAISFTNPYSLSFDGTDDYVGLPNIPTVPFTASAWVYISDIANGGAIVSLNDAGDNFDTLEFAISGGNAIINARDYNNTWVTSTSTTPLTAGSWHHVTGVFASTSSRTVYLDGGSSATNTATRNPAPNIDNAAIGRRGRLTANNYFNGLLDDVRIYNRALTATEISSLAAGTQPGTGVATYTLNSNLDVNGTLTLNSGTLDVSASGCSGASCSINVAGSWENNGGKFTKRSGTVTFDGSSGSHELQSGSQQFNNVTISNAGSWTLSDRLFVSGTLSQSAGTLDVSTNNYKITAGDFDQTAGTFTSRSGTLTLNSSSNQTINTSSTLYNLNLEDPTESGLVGYWKFDEGNGTVANDSSGSGNNGTLTNNPSWTTTVPSGISFDNPYALSFDGISNYVDLGASTLLNNQSVLTISTWLKLNSDYTRAQSIVATSVNGNFANYVLSFGFTDNKIELWNNAAGPNSTSVTSITDNNWHHISAIREGTSGNWQHNIYIDGVLDKTQSSITANPNGTTSDPVTISKFGGYDGDYRLNGSIDDVRIYNRALSAAEVANLAAGKYADGDSGVATFTLNTNLDINGNLGLYSGVLSAGSNTIDLAGNWNNYAGSSAFTAGTSTVDLDALTGSAQAVRGSNTFYNLEASTDTAQTISFESSATQTVSNALTFTGAASNLLTLAPETAATAWLLNAPSTQTVSYVSPSYSNAGGGSSITATSSTNGGNNTNWTIITERTWDGGGSTNNCSEANNWSDNQIPDANTAVILNATNTKNMTWDTGCPATIYSYLQDTGYSGTVSLAGSITTTGAMTVTAGTLQTGQDVVSNITVGTTLTINSGGTVVIRRSSTAGEGAGQTVTATNITVNEGGSLNADGMGFAASNGSGAGGTHDGGSHGGKGGDAYTDGTGATYGSITNPTSLGSGGYAYSGGGAIIISSSGTVTVNGILSANGTSGDWGSGAGGTVAITAQTLSGTGTIRTNGGSSVNVGSGGGGRISLNGVTTDNFSGTLQANGGLTVARGYAGSIYLNSAKRTSLTLGGVGNLASLRLGTDNIATAYTFGTIIIQSGGVLEMDGNLTLNANNGGVSVLNVGTLDVQTGGVLRADGLGFPAGKGPGLGGGHDGGSHGGKGGDTYGDGVGATYGSITNPNSLGSGGYAYSGGGAIIISSSGTVTVNGILSANGTSGDWGSGAGGTIAITAQTLSGTGTIRTNGGSSVNVGSGGGGRIAITQTTGTSWTPIITAYGGSTLTKGAAGTIYLQDANDGANGGELIINNNNVATAAGTDTRISSSVTDTTVGSVTLTANKAGKLTIDAGQTFTVQGTGTTLTVGAGTTFQNNGTLNLSGTTFTNNGTVTLGDSSTVAFTGDTTATTIPNWSYQTLTLSGTNKEFRFTAGATYTVADAFNASGTAGSANFVKLRSTSEDTQWTMSIPSTRTLTYVDVQDSNNTGTAVDATNGSLFTDSGNNTGWTFDTVAPTTTPSATSDGQNYTFNTWTASNVAITLTCTDNGGGVGCASTYYCTDANNTCVPSTLYTTPVTITTEGTTYIRYYSQDTIPNTESTSSSIIKIDTTNPVVSAGIDQTQNSQFTQTGTATDVTSGVASYLWSKQLGTGTITFGAVGAVETTISSDTDGTFVIRLTVTDNVGNTNTDDFTLIWDATAPTTTDNFSNHNTWTSANQTITLTPADATSGVSWTKYCTDTTNECTPSTGTTYTTAVTITTEGTSYFRYASQDTAGNTQTTVSKTIKIDTQAPTSTIDSLRETNSITTTVTCVDGSGSGCSVTYYCTDTTNTCTPTTVYTAPVSYQITANTYFRTHSVDFVTNTSSVSSASLLLQGINGGGGSYEQPVLIREIPIPNAQPNPNDQSPKFDDGLLDKLAEQIKDIGESISNFKFQISNSPEITYPPIEQSVPQEAQIVFQGGNLISKKDMDKISILPLPEPIKELAYKFPQFAETLEKVNINKPEDINLLKIARLSFPGLSDVAGINYLGKPISKFTIEEKQKIPSNIVFARTGNDNIDFNIKIAVLPTDEPEQSIRTIVNKPLYLTIKPDKPAESVQGFVVFKSANSVSALLDYMKNLTSSMSASLLNATNILDKKEGEEVIAQKDIVLQEFDFTDEDNDGIYTAQINSPAVDGKYEIKTIINYKDKNQKFGQEKMILVVDPEGYVYEKLGDREVRLQDISVSIYWLNSATNQYELWPARDFQQQNPQITDITGKYSFLVPPGNYYLMAESTDFQDFQGEPFLVQEGSGVHINIELKPKNILARIFTIERIMLGAVIILLLSIISIILFKWKKQN